MISITIKDRDGQTYNISRPNDRVIIDVDIPVDNEVVTASAWRDSVYRSKDGKIVKTI